MCSHLQVSCLLCIHSQQFPSCDLFLSACLLEKNQHKLDKLTYSRKIWKIIVQTSINAVYINSYTRMSHDTEENWSKVQKLIWVLKHDAPCKIIRKWAMRFQGQQNNRWVSSLTLRSHDPASKRSLEKPRAETSRLVWEVWSMKEYWYRRSRFLNAGYEAFINSKVNRTSMNGWKCWDNSSLEKILPLYKQNWRKNTTYVIFE